MPSCFIEASVASIEIPKQILMFIAIRSPKNWDRVLFGPNYNFDLKTVGGYLGYIAIWDTFHLETTLATTNISSGRLDASNGYYLSADMFWRY